VIIANNQAGPALKPDGAARLATALPEADVVDVDDPQALADTLAHVGSDARTLGVVGGDGSVGPAAASAHHLGASLLVVPGGTRNRLAGELAIHDVEDVIAAVQRGQPAAMDLADVDGRPVVNTVTLGLHPRLVDVRERCEGLIGKRAAAVVATAWTLCRSRPVDVELDGQPTRLWLLWVGNGCYPDAGVDPPRRRRLDDGLFDARLAHADAPFARVRLAVAAASARLGGLAPVEARTADHFTIRAPHQVRVACDGETVTVPARFTIRKRPRPLAVLVPSATAAR
jgi:undecaprenyl-diphosphatase